jgi:hypothetical protein
MVLTRASRDAWLSLTPEPEGELPRAVATLRAGGSPPSAEAIEAERARAERLVLRGSRRRWHAWLRESLEAAEDAPGDDPALRSARRLVLDVIANHHQLVRGLPGEPERAVARDEALLVRIGTRTEGEER